MRTETFYGQLTHVYVVHLPACTAVGIAQLETILLAQLLTCTIAYTNDLGMCYYKKTGAPTMVDLACIQNVVGHVHVPHVSGPLLWAILDHSREKLKPLYIDNK